MSTRVEKAMLCSGCGRWCPASRWMTTKACGLCLSDGRKDERGRTPFLIRDVQMRTFNDDDTEVPQ